MIKIIRFKPFGVKDLQFVKLINPFEDAGLVIDLPNDVKTEITLLQEICNDPNVCNYRYSHILTTPNNRETPSSLYQHIHDRDDALPILCAYNEKNGRRTDIHAIRTYHELQSILRVATEKGHVKPSKSMV